MFAAVGGLTFGLLGIPAGYLSGSILAVACASLAGRPMRVPTMMMRVLVVLIGISLGAVVTPETLRGVATYPVSIAVLIAATIAISVAGTMYLRVVHGWDRLTAYLAAVPGGLSQVMALAIEFKADVRAIAIVQTIRIIILAVGLPALFAALGLVDHATGVVHSTFQVSQLDELAILVVASTAVAIIAHAVRFPGGLLFGAMLTSAALHGTDTLRVVMPWWVSYLVMIAFGAVSGARFANTPVRLLLRFVGAAFGVFAVAVVITAGFAVLLLALLDIPVAEVMVAYAPGAVDAMLLLALALNFDPVYVGTHHLVRIFFVMVSTPFVVRLRARGAARGPAVKPSPDSVDD
ncbi:MAG: AbrB family transcriptional regulator [Pseudolabrys sp.]